MGCNVDFFFWPSIRPFLKRREYAIVDRAENKEKIDAPSVYQGDDRSQSTICTLSIFSGMQLCCYKYHACPQMLFSIIRDILNNTRPPTLHYCCGTCHCTAGPGRFASRDPMLHFIIFISIFITMSGLLFFFFFLSSRPCPCPLDDENLDFFSFLYTTLIFSRTYTCTM